MRVFINGFGRIGRALVRAWALQGMPFEIAAINSRWSLDVDFRLLKWDSVHDTFEVEKADGALVVNGVKIPHWRKDAEAMEWPGLLVEASGAYRRAPEKLKAKRVLFTAPAKAEVTIIPGINDNALADQRFISMGSCTTNCLAHLIQPFVENILWMEAITVHAVTNDQRILDGGHRDPRRARSLFNIIPTSSGASVALGEVFPALRGRVMAMRVPVPDGSAVMAALWLNEDINDPLKHYVENRYVRISRAPMVSSDVVGDSHSCIVDAGFTDGGNPIRLMGWYDNEWGYANRLLELIKVIV